MKNSYFYQNSLANIYAKPSVKSEVTSQILYGEKFKILNRKSGWVKILTVYDNYYGYIQLTKFINKFQPSHKIYKSKTRIFKKVKKKFYASKNFLYFASKISLKNFDKKFAQFEKNKWVKIKDIKPLNYYEKNFIKISKIFLNSKYLWGGKTSDGIDCSALVQIYFFFNNIFFPRDTKDQIKFIRKIKNHKLYKKNILLYWKGHVAICLNKSSLIHAYGPKKKVVIMKKNKTINEIKKNVNLNLEKI